MPSKKRGAPAKGKDANLNDGSDDSDDDSLLNMDISLAARVVASPAAVAKTTSDDDGATPLAASQSTTCDEPPESTTRAEDGGAAPDASPTPTQSGKAKAQPKAEAPRALAARFRADTRALRWARPSSRALVEAKLLPALEEAEAEAFDKVRNDRGRIRIGSLNN